jgi:hypothetical protein
MFNCPKEFDRGQFTMGGSAGAFAASEAEMNLNSAPLKL